MMPILPNLYDIKLLSFSVKKLLNMAGIHFGVMILSKGSKKFSVFSIVIMKNVKLCLYPDVNAKYVACES